MGEERSDWKDKYTVGWQRGTVVQKVGTKKGKVVIKIQFVPQWIFDFSDTETCEKKPGYGQETCQRMTLINLEFDAKTLSGLPWEKLRTSRPSLTAILCPEAKAFQGFFQTAFMEKICVVSTTFPNFLMHENKIKEW